MKASAALLALMGWFASTTVAEPRRYVHPTEERHFELKVKLQEAVTVEMADVTVEGACQQLARLLECTIVVDPAIPGKDWRLSLPRTKIVAGRLLRWLCHYGGATHRFRYGAIIVTTPEGEATAERSYDIANLLMPAVTRPRSPDEETQRRTDAAGESFVNLIRAAVAPETWARPGHSATYAGGKLTVVHTEAVHEAIRTLLDDLRRARSLQVHILARFVAVKPAYLDSLGLTYDLADAPPTQPLALAPTQPFALAPLRFARLDEAQTDAFVRSILKERKGTFLAAPRLTCFNTQRASFQVVSNYNYVRRISNDNEPEIGGVPEGIFLDVQPLVSADRRRITVLLEGAIRLTGRRGQLGLADLAGAVTLPDGGTSLLRCDQAFEPVRRKGLLAFLGLRRAREDQALAVLLTAQVVPDIFEED